MLEKMKINEIAIAIMIIFLIGLFFGVVIGIRLTQNSMIDLTEIRAEIDAIKEAGELAEQLDRVMVIYNGELREVMDKYIKALKILENGR